MVQLSSIFTGFTKSIAIRNGKKSKHDVGREAADALAKEAKKKEMMLTSSGCVAGISENLAAVFSKGGKKGINQDRFIVWEDFGCQDDMIFCGVFDGHGPWGHLVAKRVRKLMPPALHRNWQKRVAHTMDGTDGINGIDTSCFQFDIWKQSYFETCSIIDQELEQHADSFYSGTTALTLVRQGRQDWNVGPRLAVTYEFPFDDTPHYIVLIYIFTFGVKKKKHLEPAKAWLPYSFWIRSGIYIC